MLADVPREKPLVIRIAVALETVAVSHFTKLPVLLYLSLLFVIDRH